MRYILESIYWDRRQGLGIAKLATPVGNARGAGTLVGNYKVSADVVGIQYNHSF